MNFQEEFRKVCHVKDRGIGGIHVDKYAELSAQAFQNSLNPIHYRRAKNECNCIGCILSFDDG